MSKNIILVIGDGMGWEMSRASAIYNKIEKEIEQMLKKGMTALEINAKFASRTLDNYYTSGKGEGTPYQDFKGFTLATTGSTKIAGSTSNSALDGSTSTHDTGKSPLRDGFSFDPSLNYVNWDKTKGGDFPWNSNYYKDRNKTLPGFDKEYIKGDYPDSANTASTLYGGIKTYNGAISVDIQERDFESILVAASKQGKSGGVVSSVPFNHATPAAAVANVNSRNKYQESSNTGKLGVDGHLLDLTDNILDEILFKIKPQVVLGGGNPAGTESYMTSSTLTRLIDGSYQASQQTVTGTDSSGKSIVTAAPYGKNITAEGWKVVGRPDNYTGANTTKTGLGILEAAVDSFNPNTDHLLGIYGAKGQGGNLPWRTADSDYSATGTGAYVDNSNTTISDTALEGAALAAELKANPTISQLTAQALEALGKDKDGFWLMVEVGDIDWAAHADNLDLMLGTQHDLDDVTTTVIDWVKQNGGWKENQVIVTADHDHYLTLLDNYPKEIAESILASKLGNNEANAGVNKGYDIKLTPTLTKSGTSQWASGDAEKVGHFWGTNTKLKDGSTGIGDGWWTHTSRPVPVYYNGKGNKIIDLFTGTGIAAYGTIINGVPGMIDQAHVSSAMEAILLGGDTAKKRLITAKNSIVTPAASSASSNVKLVVPAEKFTLMANTIFAGAGDSNVYNELNKGSAKIVSASSGASTYFADTQDVITGGSDNDQIWAITGGENQLRGKGGDDDFVIGSHANRVLGGAGDDKFYLLAGAGTNYLNGDGGRDQFWLVSGPGHIPVAKQFVMDFKAGEDKVGLQDVAFSSLGFEQMGADTLLSVSGAVVGHFTNVSAAALNNLANFVGLV